MSFFHAGKWFHLFLSNTNNTIYYLSFVYKQFNAFKYYYVRGAYDKFPDFFRMGI